jgi:hypothetical protein
VIECHGNAARAPQTSVTRGFGVLHEDRHFDLLATVLGFESVRLLHGALTAGRRRHPAGTRVLSAGGRSSSAAPRPSARASGLAPSPYTSTVAAITRKQTGTI